MEDQGTVPQRLPGLKNEGAGSPDQAPGGRLGDAMRRGGDPVTAPPVGSFYPLSARDKRN